MQQAGSDLDDDDDASTLVAVGDSLSGLSDAVDEKKFSRPRALQAAALYMSRGGSVYL